MYKSVATQIMGGSSFHTSLTKYSVPQDTSITSKKQNISQSSIPNKTHSSEPAETGPRLVPQDTPSNNPSVPAYLKYTQPIAPLTRQQMISLAQAEYELYRQEGGHDIPENVSMESWEELIDINSSLARKKFLRYLFLNEKSTENQEKKQNERSHYCRERYQQIAEELESNTGHISYGLWRNSMFIKYTDKGMDNVLNHKLINSRLYGQSIIFDNSFDCTMNRREKLSLAKQFCACFGLNRLYDDPFYFNLFNISTKDETTHQLRKHMPPLFDDDFLIDVHSSNYMDHFPRDKLVYLTPFCRHDMKDYDHDAVYIIGNLIDISGSEPLTLAKAKREGIKVQRLPLERWDFNFSSSFFILIISIQYQAIVTLIMT